MRPLLPTFEVTDRPAGVHIGALALHKNVIGLTEIARDFFPPWHNGDTAVVRDFELANLDAARRNVGAAYVFAHGSAGVRFVLTIDGSAARQSQVPVSELEPCDNSICRFRAIHHWARQHGYAGGFPTFIDETVNGQPCYGAALISADAAEEIWIPIEELRDE